MSIDLTDRIINSELAPYGAAPSDAQCGSIRTYIDLLLRWNRRLSLTTVTDVVDILRFHVGESIFAIAAGLIDKGRLADVGSGAGFPGIPLALFSPKIDVTLIESNRRKAAFLAEAHRTIGSNGLHIIRQRFEEVDSAIDRLDVVTARALGQYESLLNWSVRKLGPSGRIVLWLGLADAEQISKIAGWSWKSPIQIPGSANRVILTGQVGVGQRS